MALLRFLLILLTLYIVFRLLARLAVWFLHRYMVKKMGQNGGMFFRTYQFGGQANGAQYSQRPHSDTVIQGKKPNSKISDNEGEYVDFEEVK
jgi:hypothetical protein